MKAPQEMVTLPVIIPPEGMVEATVVSKDEKRAVLAFDGGEKVVTKEEAGDLWAMWSEGATMYLEVDDPA